MKKNKKPLTRSFFIPIHDKVEGITVKIHLNQSVPNQDNHLGKPDRTYIKKNNMGV